MSQSGAQHNAQVLRLQLGVTLKKLAPLRGHQGFQRSVALLSRHEVLLYETLRTLPTGPEQETRAAARTKLEIELIICVVRA